MVVAVREEQELAKIIVERLEEKRMERKMGTGEFARLLGVDRNLLRETIARQNDPTKGKRLGPTLASAALAKFPDLHNLIMSFMMVYRERTPSVSVRTARRVRTIADGVQTVEVGVDG